METPARCIVLGASAGGVESLKEVVSNLPADIEAAIFIVLHIPPNVVSRLPEILDGCGPLAAMHPIDGSKINNGCIYVAPPDHHLLINKGLIAVKKGPKENRFRPSIDGLFRSAAYTYGPRAIGVVLSGLLDDGTSGLWSIKRLGGITIVQEPDQARFVSMPQSALDHVEIDYKLSSLDIGSLLGRLVADQVRTDLIIDEEVKQRLSVEVQIAAEGGAFQKGILNHSITTTLTCPECHGALVKIPEGELFRYRCHTGHAYTGNALLEAVMDTSGNMLWEVIRSLEEGVILLKEMVQQFEKAGDVDKARICIEKAREIESRSKKYHNDVLRHENLSSDNPGLD